MELAKYTWYLDWVPSPTAFLGLGPRTLDLTHSIHPFLLHKAQLRQTLEDRDQARPGDSPGFLPSMFLCLPVCVSVSLSPRLAYSCLPRCAVLLVLGQPVTWRTVIYCLNGAPQPLHLHLPRSCPFPTEAPLNGFSLKDLHTTHSPQSLRHLLRAHSEGSGFTTSINSPQNDSRRQDPRAW